MLPHYSKARMSLDMDGTLDFVCFELGKPDNLNNLTHNKFFLNFQKYLPRNVKGKSMVYILPKFGNSLVQNLANQESCLIVRLLKRGPNPYFVKTWSCLSNHKINF